MSNRKRVREISERIRQLEDDPVSAKLEEAQDTIDLFFSSFPQGHRWVKKTLNDGAANLYVENIFGGRRHLYGYASADQGIHRAMDRRGVNSNLQGPASQIGYVAMFAFENMLDNLSRETKLPLVQHIGSFNAVHDACLAGDTLVATDIGLQRIEDMHNGTSYFNRAFIGKQVVSRFGFERATTWIDRGWRATVTVNTELGYGLQCTPDHRILVKTGESVYEWKRADSLQPGDLLLVSLRPTKQYSVKCSYLGKDMAYVIGFNSAKRNYGVEGEVELKSVLTVSYNDQLSFLAGYLEGSQAELVEYTPVFTTLIESSAKTFQTLLLTDGILSNISSSHGLGVSYEVRICGQQHTLLVEALKPYLKHPNLCKDTPSGSKLFEPVLDELHCAALVPVSYVIESRDKHVYDLSIKRGGEPAFTANGIIVHNCESESPILLMPLTSYLMEHAYTTCVVDYFNENDIPLIVEFAVDQEGGSTLADTKGLNGDRASMLDAFLPLARNKRERRQLTDNVNIIMDIREKEIKLDLADYKKHGRKPSNRRLLTYKDVLRMHMPEEVKPKKKHEI